MKLKRLLASSGALVLATSASSTLMACTPTIMNQDEHHQTVGHSFSYQTQDGSFAKINEAATIGDLANQEAQILLLASQYGLSQDELMKITGFDTKDFLEVFDLTSLEALTQDRSFHQTLGQKGAVFSLTGKDRFEITNPIATKLLNGALGKRHVTGTSYSTGELSRAVEYFMDVLYPFLQNANFAQAIKGVSSLLNFVQLSPKEAEKAQQEAGKFVDSKFVGYFVQPFLAALVNGTNLSRFANETPAVFMAQMANQIADLLGYATIDGYQPVTESSERVDQASEVINTIVKNKA